ncbi:MAG: GlsB/YeaQ/YmgE family stress response membrane protein [Phycisphaerales bacterium]|nr:MAG: GlsB/YeaQ/YmgE family stress response membrane protein [Phycisphaerales bacterium]
MHIVWFLLIGLFAGFLAGVLTRGSGFGIVGNLIVGVLGAILGGFLFRLVGLASENLLGSLITATVGAIVLLFLLSFVGPRKPAK